MEQELSKAIAAIDREQAVDIQPEPAETTAEPPAADDTTAEKASAE